MCVIDCGNNFFPSQGECKACHNTCLNCFGSLFDECTKCENAFLTFDKKCVGICPDGKFGDT